MDHLRSSHGCSNRTAMRTSILLVGVCSLACFGMPPSVDDEFIPPDIDGTPVSGSIFAGSCVRTWCIPSLSAAGHSRKRSCSRGSRGSRGSSGARRTAMCVLLNTSAGASSTWTTQTSRLTFSVSPSPSATAPASSRRLHRTAALQPRHHLQSAALLLRHPLQSAAR